MIQENAASANPNYPLTIVAAVTTQGRNFASHVVIEPSTSNGLAVTSYVKCEQLQTISKDRLVQRIGALDEVSMERVRIALLSVLSLM